MKCLENYTIEKVKEMTSGELEALWNRFANESKAEAVRAELIKVLEIRDANKSVIEG